MRLGGIGGETDARGLRLLRLEFELDLELTLDPEFRLDLQKEEVGGR